MTFENESHEPRISKPGWRDTYVPARLEEIRPDGLVRCHLSPRNCEMREGQHGFCGVRANRGGRLVTMNYGKSVHATEETIETEAVNHFELQLLPQLEDVSSQVRLGRRRPFLHARERGGHGAAARDPGYLLDL